MKRNLGVAFALLVAAAPSASAARAPCSIHPKRGATQIQLAAMAKVTKDDAEKAALGSLKTAKATVKEAELEVEHGCLVYSFDIEVEGKTGLQEVQVDAGTGKILSSKHETPKAEAAEKAKDKVKTPKK